MRSRTESETEHFNENLKSSTQIADRKRNNTFKIASFGAMKLILFTAGYLISIIRHFCVTENPQLQEESGMQIKYFILCFKT